MASEDVTIASNYVTMASDDVTNDPYVTFTASRSLTFIYNHQDSCFNQRLGCMRREGAYTDILLKVGDVEIPCHKVVLSAASPCLHDMIQATVQQSSPHILKIPWMSGLIVQNIVDYFYNEDIDITTDNVQAICLASHHFKLERLKNACDEFISDQVVPANCFGSLMYAKHMDLSITRNSAQECMLTQPKEVLQEAPDLEYQSLSMVALIECIASDDLEVDDEHMVFTLVSKWIEVDSVSRHQHADELLRYVGLSFCDPRFLCNDVESSPYFNGQRSQQLIGEAKTWLLMPDECTRHELQTRTRPRTHASQILVVGGSEKGYVVDNMCWLLNDSTMTWETLPHVPGENLYYLKACLVGNRLIVTGGSPSTPIHGTTHRSDKAWELNICTREWRSLPHMLEGRALHSIVGVGEQIYVTGGCSWRLILNVASSTCERLDLRSQKWKYIASMTTGLYHHVSVVCESCIYVMGGRCAQSLSVMTQVYDPDTDVWQVKADMPTTCEHGSGTVLKDKIYVVGDNVYNCMSYSPSQDTWTILCAPRMRSEYPAAVAWNGKIILGGGRSNKTSDDHSDDMEEYNPETNTWSMCVMSLPRRLSAHCMLAVPRLVTPTKDT